MQVVPSGGQNCNKCKWCHLVAKFGTNASCAIWWPNLKMQVEPPLVREITQVLDAIPWVRCASGNVLPTFTNQLVTLGKNVFQSISIGKRFSFPAITAVNNEVRKNKKVDSI